MAGTGSRSIEVLLDGSIPQEKKHHYRTAAMRTPICDHKLFIQKSANLIQLRIYSARSSHDLTVEMVTHQYILLPQRSRVTCTTMTDKLERATESALCNPRLDSTCQSGGSCGIPGCYWSPAAPGLQLGRRLSKI